MLLASALVVGGLAGCRSSVEEPVRTLNPRYVRGESRALVREILEPSRASLDWAVWGEPLFDPFPVQPSPRTTRIRRAAIDPSLLLQGGMFDSVCRKTSETGLSDSELVRPMAWNPVLRGWRTLDPVRGRRILSEWESIKALVRARLDGRSGAIRISALHLKAEQGVPRLWVRLEFPSWMGPHLQSIQDLTGEGDPDLWARWRLDQGDSTLLRWLSEDYSGRILRRSQAREWAEEMVATLPPETSAELLDLDMENVFPQGGTEQEVLRELGDLRVFQPLAVVAGSVEGVRRYLVLQVPEPDSATRAVRGAAAGSPRSVDPMLPDRLDSMRAHLEAERDSHGGTWESWVRELDRLRRRASSLELAIPTGADALPGIGWTLLSRRELRYIQSGGASAGAAEAEQRRMAVALRDTLAELGIDFLLVPVPTKFEANPGLLGGWREQVVQPWTRKILHDLSGEGVESLDLRGTIVSGEQWRKQDERWSPEGLQAVVDRLAGRVEEYPWFGRSMPIASGRVRDTLWTDDGNLVGRLEPRARARTKPERMRIRRVYDSAGRVWSPDEAAPILLVGDSLLALSPRGALRGTGFAALLSARLSRPVTVAEISGPMAGWGGGLQGAGSREGLRLVVFFQSQMDWFASP